VSKSIQLQSLRGIAVLLVVLFHMGLSAFHNGWVGVDIFFVISGFLMWVLYRNPILNGRSAYFYTRRLRRLLPALSVLLIFSNFIFFFRFLPHERHLLVSESFAANIFASNINYWMGDQYFSNGSLRPLLNLWSIALEIQFYLLFPLVVYIVKNSKIRLLFLLTASFATFLFLSFASTQSSFFLLPGRLWEFSMGMLAGVITQVKLKHRPNFGFILVISLAFLAFTLGLSLDRTQTIAFQVVTVCIFSLLVWSAWSAQDSNILLAVLGKLGDYSYSIYLIHFPLIVLIAYQPFLGNPTGIRGYRNLLLFSSCLVLLSWLSKRYVEDSDFFKRNFIRVWGVSLSFSVLLLFLQPLTLSLGFSSKEIAVSNASKDRGDFRCGLLLRLPLFSDPSKTCLLAESPKALQRVLLIGNSHANAIKEAVVKALPKKSVYLLNENNPLSYINLKTYEEAIGNLRPETVILHSSSGSTNLEALESLVRFTSSQGIKFVVINPVPTPGFDVPSKAYSLLATKRPVVVFADANFTLSTYDSGNKVELDFIARMASTGEVIQIPLADLFCKPYCQIVDSRSFKPLYFDSTHLTKTGASKLVSRIRDALE
jgi:peptidoglycan/LPS O-acetylase OafA/YrhL